MHPRVQEVLSELDARRAHLHQTVASIPSSVRDVPQVPSHSLPYRHRRASFDAAVLIRTAIMYRYL